MALSETSLLMRRTTITDWYARLVEVTIPAFTIQLTLEELLRPCSLQLSTARNKCPHAEPDLISEFRKRILVVLSECRVMWSRLTKTGETRCEYSKGLGSCSCWSKEGRLDEIPVGQILVSYTYAGCRSLPRIGEIFAVRFSQDLFGPGSEIETCRDQPSHATRYN